MAQISFDSQPLGRVVDPNSADVRNAPANCAFPAMVNRKILGQTTPKVVRLANIYRLKRAGDGLLTKDVDAADLIEHSADVIPMGRMLGPV
jgi:hypothetical protein